MSDMDDVRSREPVDRMTRLCDAMTTTLEAHPEYTDDIKCCVFMHSGKRSGLVLFGYEQDSEAIADLFIHLKHIMKANGKEMEIIFVPPDARDL